LLNAAAQSGLDEMGVLWYGSPGNGKTTAMLRAWQHIDKRQGGSTSMRIRHPWLDKRALWTQASEYCRDVNSEIEHYRKWPDFDTNYSATGLATVVPCLFFDDLGTEKLTDHNSETISSLIDSRYRRELPTWFTTNLEPTELAQRYGDRTISRLAAICEFVAVDGDDRRMRKYVA